MRLQKIPKQTIVPSADHHPLLRRFWSRSKKEDNHAEYTLNSELHSARGSRAKAQDVRLAKYDFYLSQQAFVKVFKWLWGDMNHRLPMKEQGMVRKGEVLKNLGRGKRNPWRW
jgi:hypothetical protein